MITFKCDDLKNPLINRVCPICRTYGKNVKFMDLKDDKLDIGLTIITCMTCHAVYSTDCEVGDKGHEESL